MLNSLEILNFQNLKIDNVKIIDKPLDQVGFEDEDALTVVILRDPHEYFDNLLFEYLSNKKSILFTQDIINHMKVLKGKEFLQWFDGLYFVPFQNPQTFQLDIRKRVPEAIENLESFDYVVPYESIDTFFEKVLPGTKIIRREEKKLIFSMTAMRGENLAEKFIGKDIELYRRAQELWRLIEQNNFKSLNSKLERKRIAQRRKEKRREEEESKKMEEYRGSAGRIGSTFIAGWVFHKRRPEKLMIEIYKNDNFLCSAKADIMRKDLKKRNIHPTGECGFEVRFEEETFRKGDSVEVKILPDNIILPLGANSKEFLGLQ
ncbi:MAG: hypothetical protein U9R27_02750 [Campylobacterota bacterium]|nr:hypothetical protein [Campylobacterota bacterium]